MTDWGPPRPGWSGRLGPLPGLVHHEMRLPERGRGPATVSVTVAKPLPLRAIVGAVLSALEPWQPLPTPISPDMAARGEAPRWLRPEAGTVDLAGAKPTDEVIRPYDVKVATSTQARGRNYGEIPLQPRGQKNGEVLLASPYGTTSAGGDETIMIDASATNPQGRQGLHLATGRLSLVNAADGVWWQIGRPADESALLVAGRVGDPLDERQSAALARLGAVVGPDAQRRRRRRPRRRRLPSSP